MNSWFWIGAGVVVGLVFPPLGTVLLVLGLAFLACWAVLRLITLPFRLADRAKNREVQKQSDEVVWDTSVIYLKPTDIVITKQGETLWGMIAIGDEFWYEGKWQTVLDRPTYSIRH